MNFIKTLTACLLAALVAVLSGLARADDDTALGDTARYRHLHALIADEGRAPLDARLARGPDGNFYGTTRFGGPFGGGTIFRMTSKGDMQVLHAFVAEDTESVPSGLTWGEDGYFYGVTTFGGLHGDGAFYRMTLDGELTVLYSFNRLQDVHNIWPSHGLMLSRDGHFYGVTRSTVYRVSPQGEAFVLHTFGPDAVNGGLIEDDAGDLYGTTTSGGEFDHGAVFRLTKAGVLTVLHSFAGHRVDGMYPRGWLALAGDQLYGTTSQGGKHEQGIVFCVSKHGGDYHVVHEFKVNERAPRAPSTGLVLAPDGWLYGATEHGGTADRGTVYRISQAGEVTPLYSFGQFTGDGARPMSQLLLTGRRTFHGTTDLGGAADLGTVYKLTLRPPGPGHARPAPRGGQETRGGPSFFEKP
jgi:uncharacterized repeat protein (TIGR03803 family)